MTDSYPRQAARTRNFNLGLPRAFVIADDGSRVAFLRSRAGDDPVAGLWVFDVEEGVEREVFHPASAEEHLAQEEIDRRERAGEKQSGVTAFTADSDLRSAVFVSGDGLTLVDLATGAARPLDTSGRPFDPRLDARGRRVAYETGGSLRVLDLVSRGRCAARQRGGPRCAMGCRGVHRGRGDGTAARALVVARRRAPHRLQGRRPPGAGLAHRLADRSCGRASPRAVPAGRHAERDRDAARAGDRRLPGRRDVGSRGVRVRRRGLVDRGRAAVGARAVA